METKKDFKPIQPKTTSPLATGKAPPIVKSLVDSGLTEANSKGEANPVKRKIIRANPSRPSTKVKKTLKDYSNNKIIELYPKVFIILKPNSEVNIIDFTDFIHITESEKAIDLVDIIPDIFEPHYNLIANSKTRIMIGDLVTVNFKFRAIDTIKNTKQKEPVKVTNVRFANIGNMTAVVADLENGDFYPINELDSYDTN